MFMPKEKKGASKRPSGIQKGLVEFPEDKRKGVKYFLIDPFAYVEIKWDDKNKEYL